MKKKILALVLARKGSTRLKNKNIKKIKGKPLVEWTFKKLYKKNIRKLFTDVLVSTDSKKIINIAKRYKFLSPWIRPKKFSTKLILTFFEQNKYKTVGLFTEKLNINVYNLYLKIEFNYIKNIKNKYFNPMEDSIFMIKNL